MTQRLIHTCLSLLLLATAILTSSCQEQPENLDAEYGYVQFRLLKESQIDSDDTRASRLEWLADAKKIGIVIQLEGRTITQTLPLSCYDKESAEWGIYSEKLRLITGEYKLIAYYIYDELDQQILSGDADTEFVVTCNGLTTAEVGIPTVKRGKVSFALTKVIETRQGAEVSYPFQSIKAIDITVQNQFSRKYTTFKALPTTYYETFVEGSMDETLYDRNGQSAYMVCRGEQWLEAGNYKITSYTTYSDTRAQHSLETAVIGDREGYTFSVEDNQTGEQVAVQILLSTTAEYIKDYQALKEIWLALDGPNWTFHGQEHTERTNWDFNKDVDMWGNQPGITLNDAGRVVGFDISGFGAQGVVPEAIGQLTELQMLYLGNHNELIGGYEAGTSARVSAMDYHDRFLKRDTREGLSDELKSIINLGGELRAITQSTPAKRDVAFGNLTNGITGISRAMMRLTKLEQFYIANSPITSDSFIVELADDSKYKEESKDWSWGNFEMLMDFEIYNCSKLDRLPTEMLTELPALTSVNLAMNQGISAEQLKADWESIIDGASGDDIQILYLSGNNLEETPSHDYLKRMTKLGLLDLNSNRLKRVHSFGKEIALTSIYLDYNNISEITTAEDGYFCGMSQLETFSCSNNRLTELPDLFSARSVYTMISADFSSNQIASLQNGDQWRGINTETLNLADNCFEELPARIMQSGSIVQTLMLSSNGMRRIEEGALTGASSDAISVLDLSFNRLSELPESDFSVENMPYLYGVDLSYNALSKFPRSILGIEEMLAVISIRAQRDDQGNRTLREWPTGIGEHPKLSALYIGSNDIGVVEDYISPYILILEIMDNPNIAIELNETVCAFIKLGYYLLIYDSSQNISGCDALILD